MNQAEPLLAISAEDIALSMRWDQTPRKKARMAGLFSDLPNAAKATNTFYLATDVGIVYQSDGNDWSPRTELVQDDITQEFFGSLAERPVADKVIGYVYNCTDINERFEAFPGDTWFKLSPPWVSAWKSALDAIGNKSTSDETISKLSGPGLAKLRSLFSSQFGIRLQSTGDAMTPDPLSRVIMQTLDASPANPYIVTFDQHILDPFTGPGQFDLVERDARRRVYDGASAGGTAVLTSATMNFQPGDVDKWIRVGINPRRYYRIVSRQSSTQITISQDIILPSIGLTLTMDGAEESEVTIATKSGFTDGVTTGSYSHFVKPITVDKVYRVDFVPGTAGDGIFSIRPQAVYPVPPDQTPPTS